MRLPNALAAVFADSGDAAACALELERHGFARPWTAATHPALRDVPEAPTNDNRISQNEIAESSDGTLGAIGRFFTGEGNSLRRSLEDHGLDPTAAAALDAALPAPATVLVVDAENRRGEALAIVRGHRGATGLPDIERQPLEAQSRRADAVVAADRDVIGEDAVAALEREEDATYERRPPTM